MKHHREWWPQRPPGLEGGSVRGGQLHFLNEWVLPVLGEDKSRELEELAAQVLPPGMTPDPDGLVKDLESHVTVAWPMAFEWEVTSVAYVWVAQALVEHLLHLGKLLSLAEEKPRMASQQAYREGYLMKLPPGVAADLRQAAISLDEEEWKWADEPQVYAQALAANAVRIGSLLEECGDPRAKTVRLAGVALAARLNDLPRLKREWSEIELYFYGPRQRPAEMGEQAAVGIEGDEPA